MLVRGDFMAWRVEDSQRNINRFPYPQRGCLLVAKYKCAALINPLTEQTKVRPRIQYRKTRLRITPISTNEYKPIRV